MEQSWSKTGGDVSLLLLLHCMNPHFSSFHPTQDIGRWMSIRLQNNLMLNSHPNAKNNKNKTVLKCYRTQTLPSALHVYMYFIH